MKTEADISLILSGIRALCGNVTATFRSVSIELKDKTILLKCVFDTSATEDDFELASIIAAEIIADFPDYNIEEISITIPQPTGTEPLKNLLYCRHELNYYNEP